MREDCEAGAVADAEEGAVEIAGGFVEEEAASPPVLEASVMITSPSLVAMVACERPGEAIGGVVAMRRMRASRWADTTRSEGWFVGCWVVVSGWKAEVESAVVR